MMVLVEASTKIRQIHFQTAIPKRTNHCLFQNRGSKVINLTSGDWLASQEIMAYQELSISLHHWQIGHLLVITADLISDVYFIYLQLSPLPIIIEPNDQAQGLLRKEIA